MSQVYATEPATTGRVIFETTRGPIEIQLFCRECPQTTRAFLQLCMDGWYDSLKFHRILSQFLIQTGHRDMTSSDDMERYRKSTRLESALERRPYELHSRLRCSHRGVVAMALPVDEDDDDGSLQPQFFITLAEASHLDGKHVIFGSVQGPTIFNALKIGETEADPSTGEPVDLEHAPRIVSVKIVENPIHTDLNPTVQVPWKQTSTKDAPKKKKKKRKGTKNVNVLSFGDEMADTDTDQVTIKSSHDVLQSKALSQAVDDTVKGAVLEAANKKDKSSTNFSDRVKKDVNKSQEDERLNNAAKGNDDDEEPSSEQASSQDKMTVAAPKAPPAKREPEAPAAAPKAPPKRTKTESSGMSIVEARRAKYTKGRQSKQERQDHTMEKLFAFQSMVREGAATKRAESRRNGDDDSKKENSLASRMARQQAQETISTEPDDSVPTYHGQVLESDDDDQKKSSASWLYTRFKCRRHMDHQAGTDSLGGDGRDMDDYEVIDERHDKKSHSRKRHKQSQRHGDEKRRHHRHEDDRRDRGHGEHDRRHHHKDRDRKK